MPGIRARHPEGGTLQRLKPSKVLLPWQDLDAATDGPWPFLPPHDPAVLERKILSECKDSLGVGGMDAPRLELHCSFLVDEKIDFEARG